MRPDTAGYISDVGDAARRGLRLANREPGSGARRLLDRELPEAGIDASRLPGYGTRVNGHLQLAAATATGLADAGVAGEPAALAYGLAFIPLTTGHFDLIIPAEQAGPREVQAPRRVLSSTWPLSQVAGLPGCDPGRCGEHIATLPATRGR